MLAAFRNLAKSWIAKILFVLLILSFAVWGVGDIVRGQIAKPAIHAGGREVSAVEFKQMFETQKRQLEQQQQRQISLEEIAKAKIPEQMAEGLTLQQAFAAWTDKVGLRPSDKLVVEQLRQLPYFFNQVTGAFDKQRYLQILQEQGLDEERFTLQLADEISNQHFTTGLFAGLRAPRVYGALQAAYAFESRDASGFLVGASAAGLPPQPTDAQLQAYIKANETRFRIPELRTLSLVLFTPAQVAATVKIDEEELRKRYEFKKDALSQAEKRTFVQLPAPNAQVAGAIAAALRAGQPPAAVAKAHKVQLVSYDARPRTSVPDPRVAAAAFSLKPGEVSAPIQGQLGWAVVKVTDVSAGKQVTLEEARPQLEAEMRQEAATEKVYDLVTKYDEAREAGGAMQANAQKLGLPVVQLPPVNRQGISITGQRLQAAPQLVERIMDAAFSLPKGGESEVLDTGTGEYFVVRVEDVAPTTLPKLDTMRPVLARMWMTEELRKRMQQKADELAARVRKGESLQAVAAAVGAQVQPFKGLQRNVEDPAMRPLVAQVFSRKPGEAFVAATQNGPVVGKVDAVHAPATVLAAGLSEQVRPQASMQMVRGLQGLAHAAARTQFKAGFDKAQVAAAAGLTQAEKAGAKK